MIAIVGAGVFGLSLARALRGAGEEVAVYEASDRPGGTVRSRERNGFILEDGPNGFLDQEPAMRELVESLGLSSRLRRAEAISKRRFLFTRGALRDVPASPPAFLKSDVLPLGAKLRMALEPFSARGKDSDESLASFARRHLGSRATAVLIDAVQSGICAGDPEKLSVRAAFPKLWELERAHRSLILGMIRLRRQRRDAGAAPNPAALCSFAGGLSTLVHALANELGDRLHLNAPVSALERTGTRWRLGLPGRTLEADRVVVCTPAHIAADLVRPLDAELSLPLDSTRYAPVSVVHLGFRRADLPTPPQGFGFLVPHEEGLRLLGVIYVSSVFPWRAPEDSVLLTCMLGGVRDDGIASLDQAATVQLAREQLQKTLGVATEPVLSEAIRWRRAIPQYEVGHAERLAQLDARLARHPGLFLGGNAYRGIGLNDCVRAAAELARRVTA